MKRTSPLASIRDRARGGPCGKPPFDRIRLAVGLVDEDGTGERILRKAGERVAGEQDPPFGADLEILETDPARAVAARRLGMRRVVAERRDPLGAHAVADLHWQGQDSVRSHRFFSAFA